MKQQTENLNVLKTFSREIEATEKLLQCIYAGCGADLKKILRTAQTDTNWTINNICNQLKPQKDEIILFITDRKQGEYHTRKYGFITYLREYKQADNRVSGLSACYSKKEFEETRKNKAYKTLFLVFKNEDIKGNQYNRSNGYGRIKRELQELNNINRYVIKQITNGYTYTYNKHYISAADIFNMNNPKNVEYVHFIPQCCTKYDFEKAPTTENEIFDKSGYYLPLKRQHLKHQAAVLKAQKEQNQLKETKTDFVQIVKQIEKYFQNTNYALSTEIRACNLTLKEDIQKLDFLIKILKDFQFKASYFQSKIKQRILNKDFRSLSECFKTIEEYEKAANLNIEKELQAQAEWLAEFNKKYNRGE